jgi:CHAD domain-containing protein
VGEGKEALPLPLPLPAPGLLPDDTLAEAGRKTLLYHFAEMLSHEEGTLLGEEIEALHDMRVATRRMRAALDVFGPAYSTKTVQKHLKGLRTVGRALGCVRDLDVFIEKAGIYLHTLPLELQPGLDPLLAAWQQEREQDRLALTEHLNSKAHARFIQRFNRFVQTPGLGTAAEIDFTRTAALPAAAKVRHLAPTLIYTRLAAVRAFEAILPTATVPQLHALRIEFKKLRYTMEFFQEVLGPEARSVINVIKKVQDHLGDLQDAEVACQRLRLFLDTWDSGQVWLALAERQSPAGIITYLAERHTERHRLITTFPDTWAAFNNPALQRSLALAISIL